MRSTSELDRHNLSTTTVPSVAYHALVILGEIGMVRTAFDGFNPWTSLAAAFFLLAGLLTLVYPHVGMHPRYARWIWGRPPRSLVPWRNLFLLLLVCVLYAGR